MATRSAESVRKRTAPCSHGIIWPSVRAGRAACDLPHDRAYPSPRPGTLMDELQRLISVYRTRASSSVKSRLDVLMHLERIRDPRVVPFLLKVVGDPHESEDVRIHVLKQLRSACGVLALADEPAVASALGDLLADASSEEVRLQAALALGDFGQIDGVLPRLSAISLAQELSIDLRYAAFTSIERAGPTPECMALMRRIVGDEALGDAARSVLSAWHVV